MKIRTKRRSNSFSKKKAEKHNKHLKWIFFQHTKRDWVCISRVRIMYTLLYLWFLFCFVLHCFVYVALFYLAQFGVCTIRCEIINYYLFFFCMRCVLCMLYILKYIIYHISFINTIKIEM